MKKIPLNHGRFAIVDDKDYERLSQHKWFSYKARYTFYAMRWEKVNGVRTDIQMHREILNLQKGDGKLSDHKNRNGLDNRKENLRIADRELNGFNCRMKSNNTSGFRGVNWSNSNKAWEAKMKLAGIRIHCGYFKSPELAAKSYDRAATKYRGDNAVLNFPKGG